MLNIKPSNKCPRCGQRYSKDLSSCPHCTGLSEDDLRHIRLKHKHGRSQNAEWGKLAILVVAFVLVLVIIYSLSK